MSTSRRSTDKAQGKRPRGADPNDEEPRPLYGGPWPRRPEKFTLPSSWRMLSHKDLLKLPEYTDSQRTNDWTFFDSYFYNGMLDIKMEPTRLLSETTLHRLGLKPQMMELMASLGLGTMMTKFYPLYPDLARQFIASCQVSYTGYSGPKASTGRLHFKANGLPYTLTFEQICECFGFDPAKQKVRLPDGYPEAQVIWGEIAKDIFRASANAHKDIRHPVLRLFVKAIGNTLLCAMENNKMRLKHLILLAYAVGDRWDESHGFAEENRINLGALFAHHLAEQKDKVSSTAGKVERIGSLITPLLQKAGVYLPTAASEIDTTYSYMDEEHLRHGNHIRPAGTKKRGVDEWAYEFLSMTGQPRFIRLPTPYAAVDTLDDLRFMIPGDESFHPAARHRRSSVRGTGSRGGVDEGSDEEEEELPPYAPLGTYPHASPEILADTVRYRQHQESVLERMWNYLRCTRARDVAHTTRRRRPTTHRDESSAESESEQF